MAQIVLSIPHRLAAASAKDRLARLVARLQQQHGVERRQVRASWRHNVLAVDITTLAGPVAATATVGADTIAFVIELPWALSFFQEEVERDLRQEARRLFKEP